MPFIHKFICPTQDKGCGKVQFSSHTTTVTCGCGRPGLMYAHYHYKRVCSKCMSDSYMKDLCEPCARTEAANVLASFKK